MSLKQILPQVYAQLLDTAVLNLSGVETKATCQNCLRSRDRRFPFLYDKDLKCCTFYPFLPNFAVGGILKKNLSAESVVQQKIESREFSLPLGLFPTLKYQHQFTIKKKQDFGNREDLLCPYYDRQNSNCGIWEFRGVVCSTYFCRSDHGKKGLIFWDVLSDYLSYVEMCLAEECLVQLDFSPRDISDQLQFLNRKEWTKTEEKQMQLSTSENKSYWNGYTDPAEFYLKCYNHVQNLSRKEFKEILGERGKALSSKVLEASPF